MDTQLGIDRVAMRAVLASVVVALALVVVGCGDDDEPTTVTDTVTEPATEIEIDGEVETTGGEEGAASVALADAEDYARGEASRQLESEGGGFTVAEADWQVSCAGGESGGPWECQLSSGPCNGTATVTPRPDNLTITTARVGCVAD
jgi:hypothetical protein